MCVPTNKPIPIATMPEPLVELFSDELELDLDQAIIIS